MTYIIRGLDPAPFTPLFAHDNAALAARRALRRTAEADRGYPCRVSLEDARCGEELILLHHVHHDVETPYRSAFAIYVRKDARRAEHVDRIPPVFEGRWLALRGYNGAGCLAVARLAAPGEADAAIRGIFSDPAIAYIDAHNAAPGCFAARIERHAA